MELCIIAAVWTRNHSYLHSQSTQNMHSVPIRKNWRTLNTEFNSIRCYANMFCFCIRGASSILFDCRNRDIDLYTVSIDRSINRSHLSKLMSIMQSFVSYRDWRVVNKCEAAVKEPRCSYQVEDAFFWGGGASSLCSISGCVAAQAAYNCKFPSIQASSEVHWEVSCMIMRARNSSESRRKYSDLQMRRLPGTGYHLIGESVYQTACKIIVQIADFENYQYLYSFSASKRRSSEKIDCTLSV